MSQTVYNIGGFNPNAPAQNRSEEWDDVTQTYTAWDQDGKVVETRPYTPQEIAEAEADVPPTAVVVPADVTVPAADQAAQGINGLLAEQPALVDQIQADLALWASTPVGSTLTAEHLAALGRMVGGFGTVMQAITDHMVLTGTVPPPP